MVRRACPKVGGGCESTRELHVCSPPHQKGTSSAVRKEEHRLSLASMRERSEGEMASHTCLRSFAGSCVSTLACKRAQMASNREQSDEAASRKSRDHPHGWLEEDNGPRGLGWGDGGRGQWHALSRRIIMQWLSTAHSSSLLLEPCSRSQAISTPPTTSHSTWSPPPMSEWHPPL